MKRAWGSFWSEKSEYNETEFTDIFTEDELKDAPILQVNQLKTALFSLGKSAFINTRFLSEKIMNCSDSIICF